MTFCSKFDNAMKESRESSNNTDVSSFQQKRFMKFKKRGTGLVMSGSVWEWQPAQAEHEAL